MKLADYQNHRILFCLLSDCRAWKRWNGLIGHKSWGREKERRRSLLRGAHCLALPWRRPPPALQERETHNCWGSAHVRPAHPRVNKELISMQRPDRSLWQLRSQKRECTWKHIFLFFLFWIISAALMCWDIFLNRLPPVRNRLLYFFLSLGRHKGHVWGQSQAANSADGLGNKAKIQHFLCGSRKK